MFGRSRAQLLLRAALTRGSHRQPAAPPAAVVRSLLFRICKQIFLIFLVIEGIFLIEKLNNVLDRGIDRDASILEIGRLLLYMTPEIVDLALPGALLIAVYRVLLRAREDNELLVLASVGVGVHQLVPAFLAFVVMAQGLALGVNGWIGPLAKYATRVTLFETQYAGLRIAPPPGKIDVFVDHVVFHPPGSASNPQKTLIYQSRRPGEFRMISSDRTTLQEPTPGDLLLQLDSSRVLDFRTYHELSSDGHDAYRLDLTADSKVRQFQQELRLSQLLPFVPTERVPAERIWGIESTTPPDLAEEWNRELLHRIGRSLLCLQAPVLAAFALTLARRGIEPFVLPASFAVSLTTDVISEQITHNLAGPQFWLALTLVATLIAASIAAVLFALRSRTLLFLKPSL